MRKFASKHTYFIPIGSNGTRELCAFFNLPIGNLVDCYL